MTIYYWVGGDGTWDGSDATHWAASSGGAGSAGVPTSADDVVFDSASNASGYAISCSGIPACKNLTLGAPASGTATLATAFSPVQISGNLSLAASGVAVTTGGGGSLTFLATSGTKTVTSNGVAIGADIVVNAPGATVQLQDALSLSGTGRFISLVAGIFDDNSKDITTGSFSTSGSGTKQIIFGTGNTWSLNLASGTVWSLGGSNITITNGAGTATIKTTGTGATSKIFSGGGKAYPTLWFSGSGTGTFSITGANTFNVIKLDGTSAAHKLQLPATVTTTLASASGLQIDGDATHQTTLQSSSGGNKATLSCASGTIDLHNVSLIDQQATGGAAFNALMSNGCINTSNNAGWNFGGYLIFPPSII